MSFPDDLSNLSLLDLFRMEVEAQAAAMTAGLLALERNSLSAPHHEEVMRGAHSLKGAARIVNRESAVKLAHSMEDCLESARKNGAGLPQPRIDDLLRGIDLLRQTAQVSDTALRDWDLEHREEIDRLSRAFCGESPVESAAAAVPSDDHKSGQPASGGLVSAAGTQPEPQPATRITGDARAMRVAASNLDRLLGVAGESLVASRWLEDFANDMLRVKRQQHELVGLLSGLRESLATMALNERAHGQLSDLQEKTAAARDSLGARLQELDSFDRRFLNLSERLYHEVLDCRMRPFSDGTRGLPRMVRDVARVLGKEVGLEVLGESTQVDREILERVEAPLGHLLRNAVDHGIESPDERERAGKPREGTIRVEARHGAGMLLIEVSDDGRGIDLEGLRSAILRKGLTTADVTAKLTKAELLEFIFLPGFTMREAVTDISGRGVGLDVVKSMVKEVSGIVRVTSRPGQGTHFQMRLPLTLSVLRALLVEIAGEPYAFPLGRITTVTKVAAREIQSIEGREHFTFGGQQIGLVTARQILALEEAPLAEADLPVIILGDKSQLYGLVVDHFIGERELVVRALDPRLGKIKDISAAALMPDQTPALIVDVDDLLRSIENLVSGGRIVHTRHGAAAMPEKRRKRVLVVDDSLTVRELERKLIASRGYEVEVAVDGMDGWNAARTGEYDLVVTDVDMPRLDGIELVSLIKKDPRLHGLPILIVSYKDREEDRRRGLEAGADYFLTKGSFHDETLLRAVADLIGEALE